MPDIQQRNDALAHLLSADLLTADDRNVVFEAYAGGPAQTFTDTAVVVGIDTVRINAGGDLFALTDHAVTVAHAGIYRLMGSLRVGRSTNVGANACSFWIEEAVGTGNFAEVVASRAAVSVPEGGSASAEASVHLRVGAGSRYRLRMVRDWGSDTLEVPVAGAKLSIVRFFGLR